MQPLTVLFLVGSIIGGALLLWSYTESGKNWMKHLDD